MNYELSNYLKKCRKSKKLTLKAVFEKTGITNSRMHRIEKNGDIKGLAPNEIHKLAQVYGIKTINLLLKAKYINTSDLENFQSEFDGVTLLDEEEHEHIQREINFINRKKVAI